MLFIEVQIYQPKGDLLMSQSRHYLECYHRVKSTLEQSIASCVVVKNHPPIWLKPITKSQGQMFLDRRNGKMVRFPRKQTMEIRVDGSVVYSKIGQWPTVIQLDEVTRRIISKQFEFGKKSVQSQITTKKSTSNKKKLAHYPNKCNKSELRQTYLRKTKIKLNLCEKQNRSKVELQNENVRLRKRYRVKQEFLKDNVGNEASLFFQGRVRYPQVKQLSDKQKRQNVNNLRRQKYRKKVEMVENAIEEIESIESNQSSYLMMSHHQGQTEKNQNVNTTINNKSSLNKQQISHVYQLSKQNKQQQGIQLENSSQMQKNSPQIIHLQEQGKLKNINQIKLSQQNLKDESLKIIKNSPKIASICECRQILTTSHEQISQILHVQQLKVPRLSLKKIEKQQNRYQKSVTKSIFFSKRSLKGLTSRRICTIISQEVNKSKQINIQCENSQFDQIKIVENDFDLDQIINLEVNSQLQKIKNTYIIEETMLLNKQVYEDIDNQDKTNQRENIIKWIQEDCQLWWIQMTDLIVKNIGTRFASAQSDSIQGKQYFKKDDVFDQIERSEEVSIEKRQQEYGSLIECLASSEDQQLPIYLIQQSNNKAPSIQKEIERDLSLLNLGEKSIHSIQAKRSSNFNHQDQKQKQFNSEQPKIGSSVLLLGTLNSHIESRIQSPHFDLPMSLPIPSNGAKLGDNYSLMIKQTQNAAFEGDWMISNSVDEEKKEVQKPIKTQFRANFDKDWNKEVISCYVRSIELEVTNKILEQQAETLQETAQIKIVVKSCISSLFDQMMTKSKQLPDVCEDKQLIEVCCLFFLQLAEKTALAIIELDQRGEINLLDREDGEQKIRLSNFNLSGQIKFYIRSLENNVLESQKSFKNQQLLRNLSRSSVTKSKSVLKLQGENDHRKFEQNLPSQMMQWWGVATQDGSNIHFTLLEDSKSHQIQRGNQEHFRSRYWLQREYVLIQQ